MRAACAAITSRFDLIRLIRLQAKRIALDEIELAEDLSLTVLTSLNDLFFYMIFYFNKIAHFT